VDLQESVPESVLNFYRRMIALRQDLPDLKAGAIRFEETPEPLLAFRRGEGTFCAFNLGTRRATMSRPQALSVVLASDGAAQEADRLILPPNGFLIGVLD
jgi:alpha-glucosidase